MTTTAAVSTTGEYLSLEEAGDLARLESVIAGGVDAFRRVGDALTEVLERRLYRASHRSFEAYLAARWSITRRRGYQLIEAAAVSLELEKNLCTVGTQSSRAAAVPLPVNERQARELARAPHEQRAGTWSAALEAAGGAQPTANLVAELVEKARRGLDPAVLAVAARGADREAALGAVEADEETREGNEVWHVGKARWHVRQVVRHLRAAGWTEEEAALATDDRIVGRHGLVEPRS